MKALYSKILSLGHHQDDNEEVKLQKTLLTAFALIIGILAVIWGGIYFYFDEVIAAFIPWTYASVSFVSVLIFSQSKSYSFFRISQLLLSLVLPLILMIALGGFTSSSGVVLWSFTSPLGALVFKGRKEAKYWLIAFIILVFVGFFIERRFAFANNKLPENIINIFFVMNIAGVAATTFILVRYFVGEKSLALTILENKHKWIKNAFSSYISPNLVDYLIKNPNDLKLGGERRECTFIFTDLVGFTSVVEQSDPATLVSYLNEYFEEMTNIVFRHEGTVSKIVGDAIAVMFSAPVIQKDHAERAVACALEMDRYAQNFANQKRKLGLDIGRTRIGVNTGNVIIGNMGGKNQLDYRALGDAVNVAARLESANKYLGTRVCVSETTVEKCSNFIGRPIGSLLLKGKSKPVKTYEPLNREQINSENVRSYLSAFALLNENTMAAKEAFKKISSRYSNDRLAKNHYDRLNSGKSGTTIILPYK